RECHRDWVRWQCPLTCGVCPSDGNGRFAGRDSGRFAGRDSGRFTGMDGRQFGRMAMNGMWSNWLAWSPCSRNCGGGWRHRDRVCDNPRPSNGGRDCPGPRRTREPCNTHTCRG
ncbi:unnamed protein product, partial [Meganyctiphanes norvegica]